MTAKGKVGDNEDEGDEEVHIVSHFRRTSSSSKSSSKSSSSKSSSSKSSSKSGTTASVAASVATAILSQAIAWLDILQAGGLDEYLLESAEILTSEMCISP
jgi:hypothetical protein